MPDKKPELSIISPSWNTGRFAETTIQSIQQQTFKGWEHIIIDNESDDGSLDIFKKHKHIKLVCEKDRSPDEGFRKGLALAQGDYITFCGISDGYINHKWYELCLDILERQPQYSLVWGIDQIMLEDGTLNWIPFNHLFKDPAPTGPEFLSYWLDNFIMFHERNLIVRKNVMEKCYPHFHPNMIGNESAYCTFFHNFNANGYLPYFLPILAAYGRQHENAASCRQKKTGELDNALKKYYTDCENFKRSLLKEPQPFYFKDGAGNNLSETFDRDRYLRNHKQKFLKNLAINLLPPFLTYGLRATKREITRLQLKLKGER
ncbi:MAG: glycosyltransferase [Candidatus Omnitrophica bacterium]|nr:glycosyltransferase [Candidatus Omnitrophota bacterium]